MDDNVREKLLKQHKELISLGSNVDLLESDGLACEFLPLLDSLLDGFDGTDAGVAVLLIYLPPVEIINNHDFIAKIGKP